jgi:hydroxyacylglutathione hydrolase
MNIIEINKINEKLYILNENINPNAYFTMALVIGSERAAIIDTGYGASKELYQIIKKITEKPIICLLTHCDPDHAGGATLFEEIYMSSLDEELMKKGSINPRSRMMVVKNSCNGNKDIIEYVKKSMVKNSSFQYKNILDGQVFELGDLKLEAFSLPGHSKGSMCFINRKDNYAVTGDSIANANSPVLFFDKCLSLSAYKQNLERFIKNFGKDIIIYSGHDIKPMKKQIIPEILTLCDEILNGNTSGDTPYVAPFLKLDLSKSNLVAKIIISQMMKNVSKKQLGNSLPLEHRKPGFIASIKYNANKI